MCLFSKNKKQKKAISNELANTGACAVIIAQYVEGDANILPGTKCKLYAFDDHLEIHIPNGRSRTYSYSYEVISDVQVVNTRNPRLGRYKHTTYWLRIDNMNMCFYIDTSEDLSYNLAAYGMNDLFSFVENKLRNADK